MLRAYGVWQKKKFMGREYMGLARWTFLIGPDGEIKRIFQKVKPGFHTKEVLAAIDR